MTMYKDESEIQGRGCFTDCYLRPGTDFNVPSRRTDVATDHSVTWDEDGDWWEFYCPYRFVNHSETPNAEFWLDEDDNWHLSILCEVCKDEEITIYYGEDWDD